MTSTNDKMAIVDKKNAGEISDLTDEAQIYNLFQDKNYCIHSN